MKDKTNIEKLIKNIRENGVKVYIVPNNESNNLTQLDIRIMIENNLDNIKKESKQANNFAEILEQLRDVIEFKEEKMIDKEYIDYLKSFETPRIISEREKDTLEYEKAIYSGDIIWKMEYINGKFESVGHLTDQGYQMLPMSRFHRFINWFLNLI